MICKSAEKFALFGGESVIPEGMIKTWPPVDKSDEKLVLDALYAEKQARGDHNIKFEQEFAEYNGNKHAIFTNSGTAALHMALVGCGVGAGDHVLVSAYSWSSSATCILHHNAIPIFVDIDYDTINIDVDKIEAAITPRTKAIVVVHLHGLAVNMDKVMQIAEKHDLKVIEDACQAHGATFNGKKTGTMGHATAFSFNQNKCLSCGEGGMLVTDDDEICKAALSLWSFGETRKPEESRDYHVYALGWMYRNNEITAAFGRAQLAKYPKYFDTLRANGNYLQENLKGIDALVQPTEPEGHVHNWYNYNLRINWDAVQWTGDKGRFRDAVCKVLQSEGLPCVAWQQFILPEMTVFQAKNAYGQGCPWSLPGADEGVTYNPQDYPVAQRHCESYIALVVALRAPNGLDVAEKTAEAVRKVFENINDIDPDEVEAVK
ncbi:MAG: DegT/DnrJ/EryC1/StrS family aminotransferase [Phycisphaerae bacterium]|nr:DegT/DnrJ/EryC1/StrS family aminotransferase [Phycisphaerae bacterium]